MATKRTKKPQIRRTIVEEEVDQPESDVIEPEVIAYDPAQEELVSFLQRFGPDASIRAKLMRTLPTGQSRWIRSYSPMELGDDPETTIQKVYGGGDYSLQVFKNGRCISVIPVSIADPPGNEMIQVDGNGNRSDNPMMQMLLEDRRQAAEDRRMFMQALATGRSSVGELADAVRAVNPPAQNQLESMGSMLGIMKTMMEFVKETTGGAPKTMMEEIVGVVKDAAPALIPMFMGARPNPPQLQAAPEAPQQPPTEEQMQQQENEQLKMLFSYLKTKVQTDPSVWTELVLENMDDPLYANLLRIVRDREFAFFEQLDPEVGKPPNVEFFRAVYDGLRSGLFGENQVVANPGGKGGNNGNVAPYAKSGGKGGK